MRKGQQSPRAAHRFCVGGVCTAEPQRAPRRVDLPPAAVSDRTCVACELYATPPVLQRIRHWSCWRRSSRTGCDDASSVLQTTTHSGRGCMRSIEARSRLGSQNLTDLKLEVPRWLQLPRRRPLCQRGCAAHQARTPPSRSLRPFKQARGASPTTRPASRLPPPASSLRTTYDCGWEDGRPHMGPVDPSVQEGQPQEGQPYHLLVRA